MAVGVEIQRIFTRSLNVLIPLGFFTLFCPLVSLTSSYLEQLSRAPYTDASARPNTRRRHAKFFVQECRLPGVGHPDSRRIPPGFFYYGPQTENRGRKPIGVRVSPKGIQDGVQPNVVLLE